MNNDTRARKIASEWHGGGRSAMYAFCSTGAIDTARHDHNLLDEVNACYPSAHNDDDFQDIEWLTLYVREHGTRGPVDGWGNLHW